jgi:hypothetical protein
MTDSLVRVGPVLDRSEQGTAIVAAIRELNPSAQVIDHGAYVRVLVPGRCIVRRTVIERHLGRAIELPCDLEVAMPSFQGIFTVDSDGALWRESAR